MTNRLRTRTRLLARIRRLQTRIKAIKRGLLEGEDRRRILRQIAASREEMDTLMAEGLKAHYRANFVNRRMDSTSKQDRIKRAFM
jgi:DNA-binding FrmR family transcriptional regulator